MLSIKDFADSLENRTTSVRNRPLKIRALSARETSRLNAVYPAPEPPLARDPEKGSMSLAPNPADPGYMRRDAEWSRQRQDLEVLVSCGFVPEGWDRTGDKDLRAALEELLKELHETFTRAELTRLWREIRELFDERAQARIRSALIVDAGEVMGTDWDHWRLPENYGKTVLCAKLDVCMAYGIDPRTMDEISPGLWEILLSHHAYHVREGIRKSGAGLGVGGGGDAPGEG